MVYHVHTIYNIYTIYINTIYHMSIIEKISEDVEFEFKK